MTTKDMEARLHALEAQVEELQGRLEGQQKEAMVSIICFSGEWDRLFAALTIASGAAAMGQEVHLFFTFWSVAALRQAGRVDPECERDFSQSMLARLMPCGIGKARLSHMNCFGLGKVMLKRLMKKQGVDDIDVLINEVKELGAHLHLCDTSSGLFGLSCAELEDGDKLDRCGVATFLGYAFRSNTVLFI